MEKPDKKVAKISFRVSEKVSFDLDTKAQEMGVTRSELLLSLVEQFLAGNRGVVISHPPKIEYLDFNRTISDVSRVLKITANNVNQIARGVNRLALGLKGPSVSLLAEQNEEIRPVLETLCQQVEQLSLSVVSTEFPRQIH